MTTGPPLAADLAFRISEHSFQAPLATYVGSRKIMPHFELALETRLARGRQPTQVEGLLQPSSPFGFAMGPFAARRDLLLETPLDETFGMSAPFKVLGLVPHTKQCRFSLVAIRSACVYNTSSRNSTTPGSSLPNSTVVHGYPPSRLFCTHVCHYFATDTVTQAAAAGGYSPTAPRSMVNSASCVWLP